MKRFASRYVIEWVGRFDTSNPSVEDVVISTLYPLICIADEKVVKSLCHADDEHNTSILPTLLTAHHGYWNEVKVCFYLLDVYLSYTSSFI